MATSTKEKITWKLDNRNVEELKGADYNPRKVTEQDERDLQRSIEEFGTVMPVIINIGTRNNVIIGGHFRVSIYKKQGRKSIDVMVPSRELTLDEEKRLNIRLNKNLGQWDHEKLKAMDLTLLLDVGFEDEDMQVIFDDVEILDDDFRMPKGTIEMKTPRTKPGDIIVLGNHKLMCGDSTNKEHVAKLMGTDLADMIYCDPPYNIGLDYNKGTEGSKDIYGGQYTGKKDSKKTADYASFIDTTIKNALTHAKPNCHVFYWCDEAYIWLLQTIYRDNKIKTNRVCLWIKNNSFPKPQVAFNKVYEPCIYGTVGSPFLNKNYNGLNEVMNKEVSIGNQGIDDIMDIFSIWLVKRDTTQDYEHPTQKPVTLAEKPLKRCSAPGHVVLDLFGGSGSTMLACEQVGRQARMMEQDPVFCDVIVKRWEEWTNKKAKR